MCSLIPNGPHGVRLFFINLCYNSAKMRTLSVKSPLHSLSGDLTWYVLNTHPMKTNRKTTAVMRAPREAGDNIPNIAKTKRYKRTHVL